MKKTEQLVHDVITYQMKIVVDLYVRVSTDPQENNTSFEEQEETCRQFCKDHGLIVGMVHTETFTGYQYRERAKLNLMRQRYRDGVIQGVVIRTLDRLSRSQTHVAILLDEMEHHKITLYCVKEKIDDTVMGKFARIVLAFVAEMEREKIMDRTITGRVNKAIQGKIVGGKKPRYGWKWNDPVKKDYLVIDEEAAKNLRWLAENYANGVPCQTLAKKLTEDGVPIPSESEDKAKKLTEDGIPILSELEDKAWTNKTIRRFLMDIRMTGTGAQSFTSPKPGAKRHLDPVDLPNGTYPAIISLELYERIMIRAEANKEEASRNGQHHEQYLLRASFVRCAECNHAMAGIVIRDKRISTTRFAYRCAKTSVCAGQTVPSVQLDAEVWSWMEKLADHADLIEQAIALATNNNSFESELKAAEATLQNWNEIAKNYMEDLKDSNLRGDTRAGIRNLLNEANKMIEQLEGERVQIMLGVIDKERERKEYEKLLIWCRRVKEAREDLTYLQKRDFLRMLGAAVYVHKKNRNYEEMTFDVLVALPAIQNVIYQNMGGIVGHTSTRRP